jgi:hypothetical protein
VTVLPDVVKVTETAGNERTPARLAFVKLNDVGFEPDKSLKMAERRSTTPCGWLGEPELAITTKSLEDCVLTTF